MFYQRGRVVMTNKNKATVCGVGITVDEVVTDKDGKILKEYSLWTSMLNRSYSEKYQSRFPSYKGSSVSDNFKYYPYFKDWCNNQKGYGIEGWELDKDILVKGNKVYSEDTCCFVPKEINQIFTGNSKTNSTLPQGVCLHKRFGKYFSTLSTDKGRKYLGYFSTPEEALIVYKRAKEDYIKYLANKWKDQIDPRVYEALVT